MQNSQHRLLARIDHTLRKPPAKEEFIPHPWAIYNPQGDRMTADSLDNSFQRSISQLTNTASENQHHTQQGRRQRWFSLNNGRHSKMVAKVVYYFTVAQVIRCACKYSPPDDKFHCSYLTYTNHAAYGTQPIDNSPNVNPSRHPASTMSSFPAPLSPLSPGFPN